jgi:hypothetical protein
VARKPSILNGQRRRRRAGGNLIACAVIAGDAPRAPR